MMCLVCQCREMAKECRTYNPLPRPFFVVDIEANIRPNHHTDPQM